MLDEQAFHQLPQDFVFKMTAPVGYPPFRDPELCLPRNDCPLREDSICDHRWEEHNSTSKFVDQHQDIDEPRPGVDHFYVVKHKDFGEEPCVAPSCTLSRHPSS